MMFSSSGFGLSSSSTTPYLPSLLTASSAAFGAEASSSCGGTSGALSSLSFSSSVASGSVTIDSS